MYIITSCLHCLNDHQVKALQDHGDQMHVGALDEVGTPPIMSAGSGETTPPSYLSKSISEFAQGAEIQSERGKP